MPAPDPMQLGFELPDPAPSRDRGPQRAGDTEAMRTVRVRPDVVGMDRELDYLVDRTTEVHIGDVVHITIGPRRERGWIVGIDVDSDPSLELVPIRRLGGRGPTPELIELAAWAAWRWAGRIPHLLRTATPPAIVHDLPAAERSVPPDPARPRSTIIDDALDRDLGLLELGPAEDRYALARAAVTADVGHALLLCPTALEARALARRLRGDGVPVALLAGVGTPTEIAREWARARAGCTVVGTRSAIWAPMADLARIVVFDEHDESHQGEQAPTWNARDVAIERARRAGRPCLLVSATPSPEARTRARPVERSAGATARRWPRLEIIDKRELDPIHGPLFSEPVVRAVRGPGRVLCVLNRTGRVRLLVCTRCEEIARCADCDGSVALEVGESGEELVCSRDDHRRPPICLGCSATRFKHLRLGVSRAREDLERLAREPVGEVTASTGTIPDTRVLIGTEALLRRVGGGATVLFLDFDQHLLATRHRAGQEALALLGLAARIVSRAPGARLIVQTRDPENEVLSAVRAGDPGRFAVADMELHRILRLPPFSAMALVSGAGAPVFIEGLRAFERPGETPGAPGEPPEPLEIQGPVEGVWRVRAPDHRRLCDALDAVDRPEQRLRIEVDPRSS